MTKNEKKLLPRVLELVLDHLKRYGGTTKQWIAHSLRVPEHLVQQVLERLNREGKVTQAQHHRPWERDQYCDDKYDLLKPKKSPDRRYYSGLHTRSKF